MVLDRNNESVQEAVSLIRKYKEYLTPSTMSIFLSKIDSSFDWVTYSDEDQQKAAEISGAITQILINVGIDWLKYATQLYAYHFAFIKMDKLIIPNNIKNIGNSSFMYSDIPIIVVPKGTSVDTYGLYSDNLKEVHILDTNLDKWDREAFEGSDNIKDIYFSGTIDEWNDRAFWFNNITFTVHCADGEIEHSDNE
jgi:hypothetical protein